MAQINLLPWREQLREEKKRGFISTLIGGVIIAAGLVFLVHQQVQQKIDLQDSRNEYLLSQIQQLDVQLTEISDLQKKKNEIRDRMNVISDLQGVRPGIVRIFDELVRTLPEGVYYTNLTREGSQLSLIGVAQSYSKLTQLLRRLESSNWFSEADLSNAVAWENAGINENDVNAFSIDLNLVFGELLQEAGE
ncbi:MAG: pilus assembly protein PilN [SAR86 cluster bacterium]|uniref:Pilus assembly protein PilN n=1 Tax=SAR86 cluster bacterium TaxID=2030880 RepID=A0A2A4MMG3_9GAMM|nr:MAG: pilus assembly protein PilN [SAR86 cluster bacterium]